MPFSAKVFRVTRQAVMPSNRESTYLDIATVLLSALARTNIDGALSNGTKLCISAIGDAPYRYELSLSLIEEYEQGNHKGTSMSYSITFILPPVFGSTLCLSDTQVGNVWALDRGKIGSKDPALK